MTAIPRLARASSARRADARRSSALARTRGRSGMLLSAPALAFVGVLLFIPIGQAAYYSMTDWDGITSTWRGPGTFLHALRDPAFLRILENNAMLLLAVPVAIVIPLGVAFLLNQQVAGWRFFRSVYFLPTAISWVVIGMVATRFFAQRGLLNSMLGAAGLGFLKTDMLGHEYTALLAVAITFVWSMVGTNTIIFITGMATLDPSLYEAAQVDGAGTWRILWKITLPQLTRFIQFAFVMTIISAFTGLFSLIFVMTGGGPGYGTTTLEFQVYQTAFSQGAFGAGALYGVLLFVVMAVVGLIQVRLMRGSR
ncbi:MAG: carbohydrate transporter rane protein 1, family [Streptosporangiaceae bacterium]|nr:carbohydrate transporter rane protein 1, family [Streptosporangiaceae bacterium]